MRKLSSRLQRLLASFRRHEEGNIAIIFALTLIPVIGIAATAVDFGRASKTKAVLERAADAALLDASNDLDRDTDAIRDEIRRNLDANLPPDLRGIPFKIRIPADRGSIELTMDTTVRTSLANVVGVQKLDVAIAAKADRSANPMIPADMAQALEEQIRYWQYQMEREGGFPGGGGGSGGFPGNHGYGRASR